MQMTTELSTGLNSDIHSARELSLDEIDHVNGGINIDGDFIDAAIRAGIAVSNYVSGFIDGMKEEGVGATCSA